MVSGINRMNGIRGATAWKVPPRGTSRHYRDPDMYDSHLPVVVGNPPSVVRPYHNIHFRRRHTSSSREHILQDRI